jgi:hypothetical protein
MVSAISYLKELKQEIESIPQVTNVEKRIKTKKDSDIDDELRRHINLTGY